MNNPAITFGIFAGTLLALVCISSFRRSRRLKRMARECRPAMILPPEDWPQDRSYRV